MKKSTIALASVLATAGILLPATAARAQVIEATDTAQAGPDFPFQGEFQGESVASGGAKTPLVAQVVARANGAFRAVFYTGGFPGTPGHMAASRVQVNGTRSGDKVALSGSGFTATLTPTGLTGSGPNQTTISLPKVVRSSPTLGLKPPADAKVLFDGTNITAFRNTAKIDARGLLAVPATTTASYGSYSLHVEFQLAFMPSETGQGRSNSGIIMNTGGFSEIQVLDSFGDVPYADGCGALFSTAAPLVHANLPPLAWQTYDINFTAPVNTGDAIVTVRHNGVVVQNKTILNNRRSTTTLEFQDHTDPVFFRNIWLVPRDSYDFAVYGPTLTLPRERLMARRDGFAVWTGPLEGGAAYPGPRILWGGGIHDILGRQAVTAFRGRIPAAPISLQAAEHP